MATTQAQRKPDAEPGAGAPVRVLMLEDDKFDAELVLGKLRDAGITVISLRVGTEASFRGALSAFRPDVVLSDYSLPGFDGCSALAIARQHDPQLPVIVVSGALDDEAASKLIRCGASDFVLKDRMERLGQAVTAALAAARERRARARAEAALGSAEARFQAMIEHVSDVIFTLDEDMLIRYASPAIRVLAGHAPEQVVGHDFRDFLHPSEWRASAMRLADVASQSELVHRAERRFRRKDGAYVPVDIVIQNLLDEPAVGAILVTVRDASERKRAQEALHKSEEMFRAYMHNNPACAWLKDSRGRLLHANRAWERAFGKTGDQWRGRTDAELWPEAVARAQRDHDEHVRASKAPLQTEEDLPAADGSTRRFLVARFGITSVAGEALLGGIALDITERYHTEEQLQTQSERLAQTSRQLARIGRAALRRELQMNELRKALNEGGGASERAAPLDPACQEEVLP